VDAAGSSGTLRDIGLPSTTIRIFDGADVVVPNGLLLSGDLTNWTMQINIGASRSRLLCGAPAF
jgi:small-conductance mechanosensitive channel